MYNAYRKFSHGAEFRVFRGPVECRKKIKSEVFAAREFSPIMAQKFNVLLSLVKYLSKFCSLVVLMIT